MGKNPWDLYISAHMMYSPTPTVPEKKFQNLIKNGVDIKVVELSKLSNGGSPTLSNFLVWLQNMKYLKKNGTFVILGVGLGLCAAPVMGTAVVSTGSERVQPPRPRTVVRLKNISMGRNGYRDSRHGLKQYGDQNEYELCISSPKVLALQQEVVSQLVKYCTTHYMIPLSEILLGGSLHVRERLRRGHRSSLNGRRRNLARKNYPSMRVGTERQEK
ncbi:hypothetical protein C8J57DRAFT_1230583 [Mycena rebaudengoi]|nr:hypothetical protein C8J57DRAFT_1230583 [Mycena rebaudengoi]